MILDKNYTHSKCERKIKELVFCEFLLANPHILRLLMTHNDRKLTFNIKIRIYLKIFRLLLS